MQIIQSRSFEKTVKRLHNNQKQSLDKAVQALCADPLLGELKVGDLAGLRVYKFRMLNQLTLLAYSYDEKSNTLLLELLGSHENFHRDLKKS